MRFSLDGVADKEVFFNPMMDACLIVIRFLDTTCHVAHVAAAPPQPPGVVSSCVGLAGVLPHSVLMPCDCRCHVGH